MIDKFKHGFLNRVYGYDDYTQLEINSKLIQKMDEVITQTNESFNYLDWLKEQGLTDEVIKLMIEWKEDGTLETLINDVLFQNIQNDIGAINTQLDVIETNHLNDIESINTKLNNDIESINTKLSNNIETINLQLDNIKTNHLNVNIRDFGAKCDGITDDTEAVKKAINKIKENN